MRLIQFLFAVAALALSCSAASAAIASSAQLQVDATNSGHAVSPLLWGIFFEEINHAGEGGLYSQLVSNTNFEYVDIWPWFTVGNTNTSYLALNQDQPLNYKNLQHLSLSVSSPTTSLGLCNPGFYGMQLKAGSNYVFSMYSYAQSQASLPSTKDLIISLEDVNGVTLAKASWSGIGHNSWAQGRLTLTPSASAPNGRLCIYPSDALVAPSISLHFDMVSLFPEQGWNGLQFIRPDLGQMIADIHPAFVRFPGGCYVEGDTLDHRFNWKNSIGSLETRPGHYDLWNYYSEDGLGYYEYLLFIEALSTAQGTRVEPVWVVNNGVSHADSIRPEDLQPWIVDALDSLEFAMGSVSSKWGAIRSALGHPAPFVISIMAIGNEDCGKPYYLENYEAFYAAIKAVYPNMTLIANCDLTSSGAVNELWDFHVYQNTAWFFNNLHQWDSYSRSAAKVFESEYAVTDGCGQGNVNAAVAEAAYMTGLERNGDVISLASYAPLLVNSNDRRWNPDAIVFNSAASYGTPSYWVQYMFTNAQKGTIFGSQKTLPSTVSGYSSLAVSATVAVDSTNPQQSLVIIKAVNYDTSNSVTVSVGLTLKSGQAVTGPVQWSALYSGSVNDENTFDKPTLVAPIDSTIGVSSGANQFSVQLPPYSAHILRVVVSN